jgi:hypothetical protein
VKLQKNIKNMNINPLKLIKFSQSSGKFPEKERYAGIKKAEGGF